MGKGIFHNSKLTLDKCFPGWKYLRWKSTDLVAKIKGIDYIETDWERTGNVRFLVLLSGFGGKEESWHLSRVEMITKEEYEKFIAPNF